MKYRLLIIGILLLFLLVSIRCFALDFNLGVKADYVMSNDNTEGGFGFNGYFIYRMDNAFSFITSVGRYGSSTIFKRLSQGGYSHLSEGSYSLL